MNIKSKIITTALQQKAPEYLYHYTSPAGLLGILDKLALWATHVKFLNDKKEIDHAVSKLLIRIDEKIRSSKYSRKLKMSEEKTRFLRNFTKTMEEMTSEIYVACLTECGDQLSQWRGYCPPSGGYSVGIPSPILQVMADLQGYYFAPCIYDDNILLQFCDDVIDQMLCEFDKLGRSSDGLEFGTASSVLELASFFKHESFAEEREWRLIAFKPAHRHGPPKFRAGNSTIIPYHEFRFQDEEHKELSVSDPSSEFFDLLLQVISGSTSDPSASNLAVDMLLSSKFSKRGLGSTASPYRHF